MSYNFNKIEDQIYLGDFTTAQNKQFLQEFQIKRILSVNTSVDKLDKNDGILYKQICVEDKAEVDLISHFPECIEFIFEAQKNCENLFIHCREGLTISPSIVSAFLMKKYGFLASVCIEKLIQLRAGTWFSPELSSQLNTFERMSYQICANNVEYRRHMFRILKFQINHLVLNEEPFYTLYEAFETYSNKLIAAEKSTQHLNAGKIYRCLNCDNQLFNEINIFVNECDSWLLCHWIYIDPKQIIPEDLRKAAEEVENINELLHGIIECGKCKQTLGYFNWRQPYVCDCDLHNGFKFYSNIRVLTEKVMFFI